MFQRFLTSYTLRNSRKIIKTSLLIYLYSYQGERLLGKHIKLNNIQHFSFQVDDPNSLKMKTSQGLHIILFYRTGCPYCLDFLPTYEELAELYQGKSVTFGAVKITNDYNRRMADKQYIANHYEDATSGTGLIVATFPCIVIILDGKIVNVLQGDQKERSPENLKRILNSYLF